MLLLTLLGDTAKFFTFAKLLGEVRCVRVNPKHEHTYP